MKITIRYFGMIAEATKTNSEEVTLDDINTASNLRMFFEKKHPFLKNMSYQVAINNELTEEFIPDITITEIALLPPFAGG